MNQTTKTEKEKGDAKETLLKKLERLLYVESIAPKIKQELWNKQIFVKVIPDNTKGYIDVIASCLTYHDLTLIIEVFNAKCLVLSAIIPHGNEIIIRFIMDEHCLERLQEKS